MLHLPASMRSGPALMVPLEEHTSRSMVLSRDITRQDLRDLVRRGLKESRGRYKELLTLFGMTSRDYRRFMTSWRHTNAA